jgi:4-hydroxy-tetrahydrodipicolinate reductase
MRIAIIGYGKMGKAIEEAALTCSHEVGLIIDVENREDLNSTHLAGHDVAVEFSTPSTAFENVNSGFDAGIPVVSGTTGWNDSLPRVIERCRKEQKSLVYASNFSLGVNLLFHINSRLAALMNRFGQYEVSIQEIHHILKKDAPSGTAIALAGDIISGMDRKNEWTLSPEPGEQEIGIRPVRSGDIFGIHEVSYESEYDRLSIRHAAKNRMGFASGVLLAAGFIRDKQGFYTMQDVLGLSS